MCCALALTTTPVQPITTFAGTGANGTFPTVLLPDDTITEYYYAPDLLPHGFLRANNGKITTTDVSGDGNLNEGTLPTYVTAFSPM